MGKKTSYSLLAAIIFMAVILLSVYESKWNSFKNDFAGYVSQTNTMLKYNNSNAAIYKKDSDSGHDVSYTLKGYDIYGHLHTIKLSEQYTFGKKFNIAAVNIIEN